MANQDIREAIQNAELRLWQVANVYGVNDGNFSRKLRKEMSSQEKEKIFKIIHNLKNK